ncbi:uncharacterized protein SCHCODRAFT_02631151 [Schizophyllum commune H4-8]|uniref:Expressed protein n=1 Tax=Schizophyllum commune (strain H4-8 / FGSC 9210) TaxID=578458 RepID=D8Q9Z7_SCHCM|nr:uncharacterized protein SCHCODRAFT_02631151 [Schizophyllum commune H4-8]KAI5890211.1 hypothetical protein SCHCODRAFT_02631151 [Schizophyllum commune H4-8]
MLRVLRSRHSQAPQPQQPTHASTMPVEGTIADEGNGAARLDLNRVQQRRQTQEEQDQEDDRERKKAMKELVQSWMDRLQLISVITTFFASTEAGLLQVVAPSDPSDMSATESAANAGVLGALVLHTNAAILSFLASFLLVRYKVEEAKKEEMKIEYAASDHDHSDAGSEHPDAPSYEGTDIEKGPVTIEMTASEPSTKRDAPVPMSRTGSNPAKARSNATNNGSNPTLSVHNLKRPPVTVTSPSPISPSQTHSISNPSFASPLASLRAMNSSERRQTLSEPPIFHANPHLEQVGPFAMLQPPTHLLSRCHALCLWLSALGFVLAIMGIACFAWSRTTTGVAIFTTALIGGSALASGLVFLYPST